MNKNKSISITRRFLDLFFAGEWHIFGHFALMQMLALYLFATSLIALHLFYHLSAITVGLAGLICAAIAWLAGWKLEHWQKRSEANTTSINRDDLRVNTRSVGVFLGYVVLVMVLVFVVGRAEGVGSPGAATQGSAELDKGSEVVQPGAGTQASPARLARFFNHK